MASLPKIKGQNIDQINHEIFDFLLYVHFFKDFQYKTFRDFLCLQIALTQSIFELEKCSFFKQFRMLPEIDGYHHKCTNASPMGVVRHLINTHSFSRSPTYENSVKMINFFKPFPYLTTQIILNNILIEIDFIEDCVALKVHFDL